MTAILSWLRSRSRRYSRFLEIATVVVVALFLITLSLPFVVAQVNGDKLGRFRTFREATRVRVQRADIMRPHVLAKDSTITPLRAGQALATISKRARDGKTRPVLPADSAFWQDVEVVARAPLVDIIGGAFELPFADSVHVEDSQCHPFSPPWLPPVSE